MSAMAAAKMRCGGGGRGGKRAPPGGFVRALWGLTFPWTFLGGYEANPPLYGFALWVSRIAARWVHRRAGGSAARGRGVLGPRHGAPWPHVPAREKEYFVLSLT